MDEDPSNEEFVLSLLESYGADEAKAMEAKTAPRAEDWRAKYLAWIDRGELFPDRSAACRIARIAKSFTIIDIELYKRAVSGILQRCILIPHGRQIIRDIHAGVCGHHAAPRTLVGNAFRQGFYWPTAVTDANEVVRTCKGCQFYARKTNLPAHALQTIPVTWPFVMWGLDIVEPLRKVLLTVNSCIKVRLDLQADKSPVVVKGPFFPRVVNPRYRIRGTMCNTRI
jgi:hypothetical protein